MGHAEKGMGKFRVVELVLVSGPAAMTPAEKGTVYLSGDNVWFYDGTDQVLIK